MDCLLEGIEADFIIQIEISYYNKNRFKVNNCVVFLENEYLSRKKEKIRNFDREDNIDKGTLIGKEIKKIEYDNQVFDLEENLDLENKLDREDYDDEQNDEESEELEKDEDSDYKRSIHEIKIDKIDNYDNSNHMLKVNTSNKNKNFIEIKNRENTNTNGAVNNTKKGLYVKKQNKIIENSSTPNSNSDKSTNNVTKKSNLSQTPISKNKDLTLSPKGLYNPSVYCFMNTCMQCLISIPEINYYFNNELYLKEKKSKKATTSCNAMRDFIQSYENSSSSLKPTQSLYKVCHSFLEPNQQHDCQEFLRRFLTKIQEELNYDKKYTYPDKTTYDKVWSIYREINHSFIDTIFTGLMRSSVICNKCGYKSDTYDPFMDLSVPIKKKMVETLDDCLDNYFSNEFINCEYKCSSCKKKTSISKKLEIVISPPILTIHFKRFEDLHHKFNGSIEFRDTLDLITYTSQEVHQTLDYELFAVAVHLGRSIFSGHYVAYAKRNGKWYNFNDSSVFSANIDEALSNNAYVLFFRRVE